MELKCLLRLQRKRVVDHKLHSSYMLARAILMVLGLQCDSESLSNCMIVTSMAKVVFSADCDVFEIDWSGMSVNLTNVLQQATYGRMQRDWNVQGQTTPLFHVI